MKLKLINSLVAAMVCSGVAMAEDESAFDYSDLNIESLMKVSVTSVSKREELLSRAAAAVYVLTGDDIKRSGYTSLAEALRLVPGVNVAKVNRNSYSISVRGFNDRFANKVLVLVDGKPEYIPLFSGLVWDTQSIPIDTIERVEVIRGPGATLWGANAVNGVINVITKHAKDSTGNLVDVWGGDESVKALARHGSALGKDGAYRMYVQKLDEDRTGNVMDDSWQQVRYGFRLDWENPGDDELMLRGHWLTSQLNEAGLFADTSFPYAVSAETTVDAEGGELLAQWQHHFDEKQQLQLKAFYDKTDRHAFGTHMDLHNLAYIVETIDFEAQYNLSTTNHNLIVGANYREYDENLIGSFRYQVSQGHKVAQWKGVFVQDQIHFFDDALEVTLGAKYEDYDGVGGKVQPNMRFSWAIDEQSTLWAAAARAVATPARVYADMDFRFPLPPGQNQIPLDITDPNSPLVPLFLMAQRSQDIDVETMDAFELGFRHSFSSALSIDSALFYNRYQDIIVVPLDPSRLTLESLLSSVQYSEQYIPHLDAAYEYDNFLEGHSQGGELALNWQVNDALHLTFWYSYLDVDLSPSVMEKQDTSAIIELSSPRHQLSLAWQWTPMDKLNLDGQVRYVDELNHGDSVASYTALDLHAHYQLNAAWGFGIAGQNVLDKAHAEAPNVLTNLSTIEHPRQILANVSYQF